MASGRGGGLDDSLTAEPIKVVNADFQWLVKLGYAELVCVFTRLRMSNFYLKAILKERDKADSDNSGTVSIKEFFTRCVFFSFLPWLFARATRAGDAADNGLIVAAPVRSPP
jgi:hypothetical protein